MCLAATRRRLVGRTASYGATLSGEEDVYFEFNQLSLRGRARIPSLISGRVLM